MTPALPASDAERFRTVLARRAGLEFDDARLGGLTDLLQRRVATLGTTAGAYLLRLECGAAAAELAVLAPDLTVGETYFFRHFDQFRALADAVLPERAAATPGGQPVRLLSAGCASGEEPYSLVIAARGAIADPDRTIAVHAVDLNQAALDRAARGRYSAWSLRETPPAIRQRWFRPAGRQFDLCEAVRSSVSFAQGNLAQPDCRWWRPAAYDVVFCRNVLMYFTLAQARAAIARIALVLKPGGYLFLGHAETLRGLADGFALCEAHGAFYYRRAPAPAADRPMPQALLAAALVHPWLLPPPVIEPATGERFGEGPAPAPPLPSQLTGTADTLLTEALLLTQRGRIAAAEDACRGLLAIDQRNAGAHYLLALCRESAGDCGGAAEHDRTATGLDPGFAMPRLHLGLLARRAGDRDAARRELCRALDLLRHEDHGRLVLFGGGFTRGALVDLCDAALRQCGGPS